MFQMNDDFYEDLTNADAERIVDELRAGRRPRTGPQSGRLCADPITGLTSLTTPPPARDHGLRKDL